MNKDKPKDKYSSRCKSKPIERDTSYIRADDLCLMTPGLYKRICHPITGLQ